MTRRDTDRTAHRSSIAHLRWDILGIQIVVQTRSQPPERVHFQPLLDAAGGVRTHDLRIKSPLLYQLSYSGGHYMIAYSRSWARPGRETGHIVPLALPVRPSALV